MHALPLLMAQLSGQCSTWVLLTVSPKKMTGWEGKPLSPLLLFLVTVLVHTVLLCEASAFPLFISLSLQTQREGSVTAWGALGRKDILNTDVEWVGEESHRLSRVFLKILSLLFL